jgi:hypothetical protein
MGIMHLEITLRSQEGDETGLGIYRRIIGEIGNSTLSLEKKHNLRFEENSNENIKQILGTPSALVLKIFRKAGD